MDIIEKFEELRKAEKDLKKRCWNICEMKYRASGISASRLSLGPKSPSPPISVMENTICDYQDESKKLFQEQIAHHESKMELMQYIMRIKNSKEQIVIIEFYFNANSLNKISKKYNLSQKWICELKKNGLEHLKKYFD